MSQELWLEGIISIEAAIRSQNRDVHVVYVRQGKWDAEIRRMLGAAAESSIRVEHVEQEFIDSVANGKSHGGIIAEVGPRRFLSPGDLVAETSDPFVVMLDGIEDPFNYGQAIRALYAAGVHGLVVRPRDWPRAASVVARASAGASELMPIAVAESAKEAAEYFGKRGLRVACTRRGNAVSVYDADLQGPLFLLIGGEKRGITRSFLDRADIFLRIPYHREFSYSLGVAASAAIMGFEIMHRRQVDGEMP
jgi:23S rRNA (guanosine2251-2'-O)-methyltransferase